MSKDLPLLPTIIIEKAFTSKEVKFIRSTVLSDTDTKLKEYIHDWAGPHQNKKMSDQYIFNPNKLTSVTDLIKQKLPNHISSNLSIDRSFLLTSYIPYEIHCDYGWPICDDDEVPYYLILVTLNGEGSKTIVLDQMGEYLHFVDYKNDHDKLPVDKQMSEEEFKKDFSHCWPQEREYISVKDIFNWSVGSIVALDMRLFHLSNNFSTDDIDDKQCITMFTKVKKENFNKGNE